MHGTMMDCPLTIDVVLRRMQSVFADVEIVSRRPDKSIARTTYGAVAARAEKLARALVRFGIRKGDRVATLMWNHAEHLEAYLGIPVAGGVCHTLNLRLHPDDISYIAQDAGDRVLIVDDVLLPLFEKLTVTFERVIIVGKDYEAFLETGGDAPLPELSELDALGMCYTSGTTGKPKGVVYTHRSTLLHSIVSALPDAMSLGRSSSVLPVVPMFHVNAWGLPYTMSLVGARQVYPGPHLDPVSLLDLMQDERVTRAAGVPTIWFAIREALDKEPQRWKLARDLCMVVGGSAAPEGLIRDFDKHGITILHAWGMTETSPIGTFARLPPELDDASDDVRYRLRAKQGLPVPLVELALRNDRGDAPNDGKTSGELLIRGPWVASRYAVHDDTSRWTSDGWFCTGDVATIDAHGFVQLVDRMSDLIKSGGEWISSQDIENHLMGHPAVLEAAVIGVPDPKWSERPHAYVILRPGVSATADELRDFLKSRVAKYCVPDNFELGTPIPRTPTGKVKKTALREMYAAKVR